MTTTFLCFLCNNWEVSSLSVFMVWYIWCNAIKGGYKVPNNIPFFHLFLLIAFAIMTWQTMCHGNGDTLLGWMLTIYTFIILISYIACYRTAAYQKLYHYHAMNNIDRHASTELRRERAEEKAKYQYTWRWWHKIDQWDGKGKRKYL